MNFLKNEYYEKLFSQEVENGQYIRKGTGNASFIKRIIKETPEIALSLVRVWDLWRMRLKTKLRLIIKTYPTFR